MLRRKLRRPLGGKEDSTRLATGWAMPASGVECAQPVRPPIRPIPMR